MTKKVRLNVPGARDLIELMRLIGHQMRHAMPRPRVFLRLPTDQSDFCMVVAVVCEKLYCIGGSVRKARS
jgi:hypothetical protein